MKWEGEFPPAPPANRPFGSHRRVPTRIRWLVEAQRCADPIYWLESLPRARWVRRSTDGS